MRCTRCTKRLEKDMAVFACAVCTQPEWRCTACSSWPASGTTRERTASASEPLPPPSLGQGQPLGRTTAPAEGTQGVVPPLPPRRASDPPMAAPPAPTDAETSGARAVQGVYPPGKDVDYYSKRYEGWIRSKVKSYDPASNSYVLECHPRAQAEKVRLPAESWTTTAHFAGPKARIVAAQLAPPPAQPPAPQPAAVSRG